MSAAQGLCTASVSPSHKQAPANEHESVEFAIVGEGDIAVRNPYDAMDSVNHVVMPESHVLANAAFHSPVHDGIEAARVPIVGASRCAAAVRGSAVDEIAPPFLEGDVQADYSSEAPTVYPSSMNASSQEFKNTMCGEFISYEDQSVADASLQQRLASILYSDTIETILAFAVFLNLLFIWLDTDARADQPDSPGRDPAAWINFGNTLLWFMFALELALRFVVEGRAMFGKAENVLDVVIVASGAFEVVLYNVGVDLSEVGMIRVLRLCRLLRLMRVLKLLRLLKELHTLLRMMGSCIRTLFWSTLLLFLVMTVWACITVELINPCIQNLANQHGYWHDCQRCQRSYSTVFNANLTIFQTIIAGDSWGTVAVPVIENHPWSAVVLCGSLMTLVFGVLNLIVAVIVDTFAERRAKDVVTIAQDLDFAEKEEKDTLGKIFERIDENMDGILTFDELQQGAKRVPEFRHWLRVLDIDASDLYNLFVMVDEDASGEIDPREFIDAMYRIKNSEAKTGMRFVKHLVTSVVRTQSDMTARLYSLENRMTEVMEELSRMTVLYDQHVKMPQHNVRKSDADATAEFRQHLDKAMTDVSQAAIQATLQAIRYAAQAVGDMRMEGEQLCNSNCDLNSPSASSLEFGRDVVQADVQCVQDEWPQILAGGDQVKPDCVGCAGHEHGAFATSDSLPSLSPRSMNSQVQDRLGEVEEGPKQVRISSGPPPPSKMTPIGRLGIHAVGWLPRFGPKGRSSGPPEPSKTVHRGSREKTSKECSPQFGPKRGSASPPAPSKTSESSGAIL